MFMSEKSHSYFLCKHVLSVLKMLLNQQHCGADREWKMLADSYLFKFSEFFIHDGLAFGRKVIFIGEFFFFGEVNKFTAGFLSQRVMRRDVEYINSVECFLSESVLVRLVVWVTILITFGKIVSMIFSTDFWVN